MPHIIVVMLECFKLTQINALLKSIIQFGYRGKSLDRGRCTTLCAFVNQVYEWNVNGGCVGVVQDLSAIVNI